MSSALAAFANAQRATAQVVTEVEEDDGYTSDNNNDPSTAATERVVLVPAGKPAMLVDVARSSQQPKKKTVTLVDIANEQKLPSQVTAATSKATSLLDVARNQECLELQQRRALATSQLSALAANVTEEERDASQRRTLEIDKALASTGQQVKQEMASKRQSLVTQALQQAVQEEQEAGEEQEQAYNQQDNDFEADESALQRVAKRVVQSVAPAAKHHESLSVDRQLLKQRQQRHGLHNSKSTSKKASQKTMKDQLSSFQFQQLSLTQQRVFLAMLVDEQRTQKHKKPYNQFAMEELAKDKATHLFEKQKLLKLKPLKYAKLEDAKNCRFLPKIKNNSGNNGGNKRDDHDDDDDDGDGDTKNKNQRREDFIRRMEATERVRVEQLRRTRAETEYNARVDKKSDVSEEFLARMAAPHEATELQSDNNNDIINNQQEQQPAKCRWRDVRDAFFGRVQLDLMHREQAKEIILDEQVAKCPFAPQISEKAKKLRLGDFDERLRRDLENRRMRQEQNRLLSSTFPVASKPGGPVVPTKLNKSFEERLQKDIQLRRERLAQHQGHPNGAGRSRGLY